MTGTLKAQLAQHNMTDKLDDVLRETAEVRDDLGYPGMATPFSQLVGIQAVLNIVTGEALQHRSDEVIQYAAGFYGETVAPIDANVLDKIMAAPRAKQVAANPPEQPTIEDLRKRYGTDNDDELILRALVPEPDLEKMRAAGAVKRDYPTLSSPELDQVQTLMRAAHRRWCSSERRRCRWNSTARRAESRETSCVAPSSSMSCVRLSDAAAPAACCRPCIRSISMPACFRRWSSEPASIPR